MRNIQDQVYGQVWDRTWSRVFWNNILADVRDQAKLNIWFPISEISTRVHLVEVVIDDMDI